MFQPEISRRCVNCGAAVRASARFCPQCGQTVILPSPDDTTERGATKTMADDRASVTNAGIERTMGPTPANVSHDDGASQPSVPPAAPEIERRATRTTVAPVEPTVEDAPTEPKVETTMEAAQADAPQLGQQQAGAVDKNARTRVGKLRDASIVVFEEAPDDMGLRFVIIAVAMFVLFLLFLFLSNIIG